MAKYDRRLSIILKDNGFLKYIRPQYCPYLLMRNRMARKFKEHDFLPSNSLIICDVNTKDEIKALINGRDNNIQLTWCEEFSWESTTEKYRNLLTSLKRKFQISTIVFALPYYDNRIAVTLSLSSKVEGLIIEDLYDLLEKKGVYTCCTDIVLRSSFSHLSRQIAQYYELHSKIVRWILFKLKKGGKSPWYLELITSRLQYFINKDNDYYRDKYIANLVATKNFRLLFEEFSDAKDEKIHNLCAKIKSLLEDMKKTIESGKDDSIIWNFIDNVSFNKMNRDMVWLSELQNISLNFTKAFSVMPWTSWTIKSIFSGEKILRDCLFMKKNVGMKSEKYRLFDELRKRGYRIYYIGRRDSRQSMPVPIEAIKDIDEAHWGFGWSTENQWRALTLLAERKKMFIMIHDFCETHTPYISADSYGIEAFSYSDAECGEEQKIKSRKYIDDELKWYSVFYKNKICVYMSDHGDPDGISANNFNYSDERTHLFFLIHLKNEKKLIYDKFLSVSNELSVLLNVIENKSIDDYLEDGAIIECYDTYNSARVASICKHIGDFDIADWMQFVAYRGEKDKYVLFKNGEERYFILPDEERNHSNERKYEKRIQELRNRMEGYLIQPSEYEFFKHSCRLYDELDAYRNQNYLD